MIEEHRSLSEKFIKKGFWLYFFSFIVGPAGYISKMIISGELSVDEVGLLYGIVSLITLLIAYNDLGTGESLKFFLPKFIIEKRYDRVKSLLCTAFFFQFVSCILIGLFFFFGADFLATHYFKSELAKDALHIFAFYYLFQSFFQTLEIFYIAIQDTFAHKIIETIRTVITLLYIVFVFFLGFGSVVNYSYAWIIGLGLASLISIVMFYKKYYLKYLRHEKLVFEKDLTNTFVKYAFLVFLGASISTLLSQIDMQMIIFLLSTTDAGYYTNYLSIINIPFLLIGPILSFLFPVFSELNSKNDKQRIIYTKKIFTQIFVIVGIMFNLYFFLFSKILAYTLFGEKFIYSGVILQYSILLLIFNFLLQINTSLMAGIGMVKERAWILFKAIFFNAIGNIILIHFMGVTGAALATGMGWIFIWYLTERKLGNEYRTKLDYRSIIKNLVAFLIAGIVYLEFVIWDYNTFSRGVSFFMLALTFFFWGIIFLSVNYRELKAFYEELKRLRSNR